jgi:hypothetical protein
VGAEENRGASSLVGAADGASALVAGAVVAVVAGMVRAYNVKWTERRVGAGRESVEGRGLD